MFKHLGIKVAYKTKLIIEHLLGNRKDKTKKFEESGIYGIKSNDCNLSYYVQTGEL